MQLSAFAAARAKRKLADTEDEEDTIVSSHIQNQEELIEDTPKFLSSSATIDVKTQGLDAPEQSERLDPAAKSDILSTWIPTRTNYDKLDQGSFRVRLEADDTLCFIGEYCVQVLAGSIAFYGAVLEAGCQTYTIFAPSTHDLPLFECKSNYATAVFKSIDTGLRTLGRLSPLFSKIWNVKISDEELAESLDCSSFTYLQKASDDTLRRSIRPMHLPESWKSALRIGVSSDVFGYRPIYLICGAKSSEKSAFARCLLNRLHNQTSREHAGRNAVYDFNGIMWIDLDPSQPEFTPPGQLSMVSVRASVFGPSFTHSAHHHHNNNTYTVDHAYAFGTLDCVEDTERYLRCVKQILEDFMLEYPVHPVIITLPMWAGFSGLRLLIDTVEQVQKVVELSHAFYIGEPCPAQLRDLFADKLYHLTIPEMDSFSRRTAAESRAMQTMSYFHSQFGANNSIDNRSLKWKSIPMTDIRPWAVSYSTEDANPGIRAILQMAETHPDETLSTVLNGRIVSVAYLPTILPATSNSPLDSDRNADTDMDDIDKNDTNMLPAPTILRTESENIPYVNPTRTATLLQKHGMPRTLGHALVRAIDTQNQKFHLLTPIPAYTIYQTLLNISSTSSKADVDEVTSQPGVNGNQVNDGDDITSGLILTLGTLDTPDWAYLENGYLADHIRQNGNVEEKEAEGDDGDDKDEGEEGDIRDSNAINNENSLDRHDYSIDGATSISERKFTHIPWVREIDRSKTGGGAGIGISGLGALKRRVRRI